MQAEIANVVHPVLAYGLRLKRMAEDKEPFDLDQEQAAVKKLLLTDPEARRCSTASQRRRPASWRRGRRSTPAAGVFSTSAGTSGYGC